MRLLDIISCLWPRPQALDKHFRDPNPGTVSFRVRARSREGGNFSAWSDAQQLSEHQAPPLEAAPLESTLTSCFTNNFWVPVIK